MSTNLVTSPTNHSKAMPILRIVTGSYEQMLFGHIVDTSTGTSDQLFAFAAHIGCIKAVAISPKQEGILITGGQDEIVKLFSLKSLCYMGELFQHAGTITHVCPFAHSHVLTGDALGKLVLWRTKDWEPLTTLKGHKNSIAGIAIHPSGKLALTVSSDRQLYCWNLLRGLKATKARLPEVPFDIRFTSSGSEYVILYAHAVIVYDTASTNVISRYTSAHVRLNTISIVDATRIVVGCENGQVLLMETHIGTSIDTEQEIRTITEFTCTHVNRIRSVSVISSPITTEPSCPEDAYVEYYVSAASSAGHIGVWRIPESPMLAVHPIAELHTHCRLTSIAMDLMDGQLHPECGTNGEPIILKEDEISREPVEPSSDAFRQSKRKVEDSAQDGGRPIKKKFRNDGK